MELEPLIVSVGSVNVDWTAYVRSFPEAGETVFGRDVLVAPGGKGANQAAAARLCGARVALVARTGDDAFGELATRDLAPLGIDITHLQPTPGVLTGAATILVDDEGESRIIVTAGANAELTPQDVDAASGLLTDADCVLLQLESPLDTVRYALEYARDRGIRSILNAAPAQMVDLTMLVLARYVVVNQGEAETISGVSVRTVEEARAAADILLDAGLQCVILTLGEHGALVCSRAGIEHLPARKVESVVDSTGAGDAFIGALAYFLSVGRSDTDAVRRAQLYAGLSLSERGARNSFATRDQFRQAWVGL
jgi:ribokinase